MPVGKVKTNQSRPRFENEKGRGAGVGNAPIVHDQPWLT